MSSKPLRKPPAPVRLRRSAAEMAALKHALLERARLIYRDEGLAALSMRRMAQEFKLSTMALYSYFPNKQALLEGLWMEIFEALLAELQAVKKGRRTPLRLLEAHVRSFLGFWEQRADQFRMIYMSAGQTAGGDTVDMEQQPVYVQMVKLTRERVAACAATPPSDAALGLSTDAMVAQMLGYLLLSLGVARYPLHDRDALRERTVRDIQCTVQQGLALPAKRARR
ncbi:TetR/AcrR family transcriptional regulator [Ideonella sp.]|uniref:TetR/AcrR family transcriptional regulator n=1 Tax=Ideonella sp. TaxID=1929293 RepID=UPI00351AF333